MIPGEWLLADEPIEINARRRKLRLSVRNTGDRPIQVGSHAHFFEVNRALRFDREAAFGMRLDVPSGTALRFEPGQEQTIELVALAGAGRAHGMNALTDLHKLPAFATGMPDSTDPDGYWASERITYWCIAYNTDLVKPSPHGEELIRGQPARWSRHDPRPCLMPPGGPYKPIFAYQQRER